MTSSINSNISPDDIQKKLIDYVKVYSTEIIPQSLKGRSQWVLWKPKYLPDKDKVSKVPVNPRTYQNASSTDPATWTSFDEAEKALKPGYGLGFVLAPNDGLVGVDVDTCIVNGVIENSTQDLINALDSYTELSPSGTGIRIFVEGEWPTGWNRKGQLEVYTQGRFLTITGNHLESSPFIVERRQEALDVLHKQYADITPYVETHNPAVSPMSLTDAELVRIAKKSKRGAEFTRLYEGNWQGSFDSQSQADQSFCNMLAFWTRKEPALMDSIFKSSGLYRKKWDEMHGGQTYGAMTVERAIRDTANVFEPKERVLPPRSISKARQHNDNQLSFANTDLGNAERLAYKFGDDIRYCHEMKKWFLWNSRHWREDNQGQIFHLATLTVRAMIKDAEGLPDADRMELIKWSLKSESRDKIKALVDLAQNNPSIVINYNQFDQDPWLFNCKNGTINLKTGKMQGHRREDYNSKISPVTYDATATAPTWERFVNEIMGGRMKLRTYLQKIAGYSLTGVTSEHDVYILHGSGANGKSVFINTLMGVLGNDYVKQTAASALLAKQTESLGEEIACLAGARLVATIETDEGRRLAEGLIKQLTGGDRIRARFLYGNSFEFYPVLKLWMATNHKPRVSGTDIGIWRRLRLIPFDVSFPEEKQDKQLPEKLKNELPGILNWCIEGCLKWQQEGITPPSEVLAATSDYRQENDVIGAFLNECCKAGPGFRSTAKNLYDCYTRWCEDGGERPISQRKFGSRLRERGLTSFVGAGNRTYWYIGIIEENVSTREEQREWYG